jgi:AraC-like DNA-binding protein
VKKIFLDIEQLKIDYINKNKTVAQLSEEYQVSTKKIVKTLSDNNIKKRKTITKEDLEFEYLVQNKTQKEIAEIYNISRTTVGSLVKKYNITRPTKKEIYKQDILKLYVQDKLTTYAIQKQLGCSLSTITGVLEDAGLKNKSIGALDISREELEKLYIEEAKTLEEISKLTSVSVTKISNLLSHYSLKRDSQYSTVDFASIAKEYIEEDKSLGFLAVKYGIPKTTIQKYVNSLGCYKHRSSNIPIDTLNDLCKEEITIQEIADKLGYSRTHVGHVIAKEKIERNYPSRESHIERIFKSFLDEYNIGYIKNDRYILEGKELDFYLYEYDIGIELCGNYWHSNAVNDDKHHIFKKYKTCRQIGLTLLTIFEDEIIEKFNIVKSRILHKLGLVGTKIYARNTNVQELTPEIARSFLKDTHIQGPGTNSIYLGLIDKKDNSVVSVMSFSKPSIAKGSNDAEYELNRFSSKCPVVGGASKLFSAFITKYSPSSIISYSDLRWGEGNLYYNLGFVFTHTTNPNYWYIDKNSRKHRFSYTKHKLLEIYKKNNLNVDEKDTEEVLAKKLNIFRVYDCGNNLYTWRSNNI